MYIREHYYLVFWALPAFYREVYGSSNYKPEVYGSGYYKADIYGSSKTPFNIPSSIIKSSSRVSDLIMQEIEEPFILLS